MSRRGSKVDDGGHGHEKASQGVVSRSSWMPGSYASALSEKRNACCKALEPSELHEGEQGQSQVFHPRHIHDPGIQQEPPGK